MPRAAVFKHFANVAGEGLGAALHPNACGVMLRASVCLGFVAGIGGVLVGGVGGRRTVELQPSPCSWRQKRMRIDTALAVPGLAVRFAFLAAWAGILAFR